MEEAKDSLKREVNPERDDSLGAIFKTLPPYDPAISLLGIYPEMTLIQKDICTPVFIAASFTVARTRQQPKCPSTEEWIKNTCTAMNTRVKASL